MPQLKAVDIVEAWQAAVNRQDIERLLSLSDPDIKLVGPRGAGSGHQLLREWLSRAGVRLDTARTFARGHVVVIIQHGIWQSAEAGRGEQDVVSSFHVDGERIVRYARYDSLNVALEEAGLSTDDEVLK